MKKVSLGVLLQHSVSIAVLVGTVLEGSMGVVEPHRKLTSPGSGKGCWDSVLKVSLRNQGIFVKGPTMEVCIAVWLEHTRGGRGASSCRPRNDSKRLQMRPLPINIIPVISQNTLWS